MSFPRKYPFPDMPIGAYFIAVNPPRWFAHYVSKRGTELGLKFRTRRVGSGRRVERVA